MENFDGRIAGVAGGGKGMGRELVRHLAMAGCHVATCDVSATTLNETRSLALETAPAGTRVTTSVADVADECHIVNTSSINGLFASVGPNRPHTAYSAAKFAVRGFGEALITDLGMHAPHVRVSVVMPGHVGTSIIINSGIVHGKEPDALEVEDLVKVRQQLAADG